MPPLVAMRYASTLQPQNYARTFNRDESSHLEITTK